MVKMTQRETLTVLTMSGNTALCLLLIWRGWSGRLQFFTLLTGLAVAVDFAFYFIHGLAHWLYAPLRICVQYWLFPVLYIFAAWEAWKVKVGWLEYLLLIQVAMAVVAGLSHINGDKWTVYYLEMSMVYVNLFGIIYSIYRFSDEVDYAGN